MPRPPVADVNRSSKLSLRVTPEEATLIDRLRGALSVSDYVRGLVRRDAARRGAESKERDA